MKDIVGKELAWLKRLTLKHKFILVYYMLSLLLVTGISEVTSLWIGFVILGNFANAVRLLVQIPLDGLEE